ncbi:tetratricopeptide repeat-containing protein [Paraburkholderia hiiakae]|nr:tetratricopeptide repeat-containing protein [Paraburkholderia hiiakae]
MPWQLPDVSLLNVCAQIRVGPETLLDELAKLAKLQTAALPDAVAFFAGRVLEGLAASATQAFQLRPAETVIENLDALALTGRIDDGILMCAHAIRRLANEARHLERSIGVDEEATIVALLQIWIEWYLSAADGAADAHTADWNDWSSRTPVLRTLAFGARDAIIAPTTNEALTPLLADASTAAFAGERLIDCRTPAAEAFTRAAIDRYPRNRRVVQVRALHFSRTGHIDQAERLLLPIRNGNPRRLDAETVGILGGAYKNKWMHTRNVKHLQSAWQTYGLSFPGAADSYYLTINVAATALWLGKNGEARSKAQATLELLDQRGIAPTLALEQHVSYWMTATLAEALLLVGDSWKASMLYSKAKQLDSLGGQWSRTAAHLSLHLDRLNGLEYRETLERLLSGQP